MGKRVVYRRTLVAAVCHAIVALWIATGAITLPRCFLHQCLKAIGVALVPQQIARFLPTEDIVSGVTPGSAPVGLIAGQKIEK